MQQNIIVMSRIEKKKSYGERKNSFKTACASFLKEAVVKVYLISPAVQRPSQNIERKGNNHFSVLISFLFALHEGIFILNHGRT